MVIGLALIGGIVLHRNGQDGSARGLFLILFAAITVLMAGRYIFELWLLSTGQSARLGTTVRGAPITGSEGEGPPVNLRSRLIFFWPLAILVSGLVTYFVWGR